MATVRLTPDQAALSGLAATYNAGLLTANTYVIRNDGRTLLHVKKSGANACTVTITPQQAPRGIAFQPLTVSIPATTGDKFIGPFPKDVFNDVNGDIYVTFSEVTGLTAAVVQDVNAV